MTSDRLSLVAGVGFGAGLMFLLDPRAGRRRRALLRDRMAHAAHKTGDAAGTTARDLAHRATGVAAEARARLRHDEPSDQVLVERVRAELGRVVSHPRSIEVTAKDGHVRLAGPVLAHEVKPLTAAVAGVRGVRLVDNQLEAHKRRTDLPSLQGGAARPGVRPELFRSNWSPTTRLMVGAAGALLAMFGLARREPAGVMGAVLVFGAGLLARGLTGLETERLFGIWVGRRAVDVQMDEDLARMKTLIETGKPPRDAARKAAGQPTPATMPETPVVRS